MAGASLRALALAVAIAASATAAPLALDPPGYAARPDVQAFVSEMAGDYGFDARALRRFFAQVRYQPSVVNAMSRPVQAPPKWYEYAPRFLSSARIGAGVAFWRDHAATLGRAQREFGVPAEIVVAIIGVETFYGRNTGSYRVADALTTLAFDYPRRAEFFRNQLKEFLLLTREQKISPLAPKGSYAGAQGLPQFMPGSVRDYAIDYDDDGRVDLAGDVDDAIGSVANYLGRHGWQTGDAVMEPASIDADSLADVERALDGGLAERRSLAAWRRDGVRAGNAPDAAGGTGESAGESSGKSAAGMTGADAVGLLMLEEKSGPSYWAVFENWYVLTRYNRSRLYASAVWQLAKELKLGHAGE